MSDDYEVVTTSPLHLELMLQAPNQGATASQNDQGCEIETSLTTPEPEPSKSSTQPEKATKTSKQQASSKESSSNRPKSRSPSYCIYDDMKRASDIKSCWNDLKFSIVGGNLSKTAEKFSEQAPESVLQIIDYTSARFEEINRTAKSIPIRAKNDKEKVNKTLSS